MGVENEVFSRYTSSRTDRLGCYHHGKLSSFVFVTFIELWFVWTVVCNISGTIRRAQQPSKWWAAWFSHWYILFHTNSKSCLSSSGGCRQKQTWWNEHGGLWCQWWDVRIQLNDSWQCSGPNAVCHLHQRPPRYCGFRVKTVWRWHKTTYVHTGWLTPMADTLPNMHNGRSRDKLALSNSSFLYLFPSF